MSDDDLELVARLRNVIEQVRNDGPEEYPDEATTKNGIVLRILSTLGWNTFGMGEVRPEFPSGSGKKVDFALVVKGKPKVFIEVKKVGTDLSSHQEQLTYYAFQQGVPLAVLTSGFVWEFFLPLLPEKWEDKKVISVDIREWDVPEASRMVASLLSKHLVLSGAAEEFAREQLKKTRRKVAIGESLPEAWKRLIERPDETLVDLLAEETESICGFKPDTPQVSKFLRNELKVLEEREAVSGLTVEPPLPVEGQERPGRVRGGITQTEFRPFILTALLNLGGSAHRDRVKQYVHERVKGRLTDVDYSKTSAGCVRWSHNCDCARYTLVQNGFLRGNSPRGIWELSDKGVKEAQRIADRLNRN